MITIGERLSLITHEASIKKDFVKTASKEEALGLLKKALECHLGSLLFEAAASGKYSLMINANKFMSSQNVDLYDDTFFEIMGENFIRLEGLDVKFYSGFMRINGSKITAKSFQYNSYFLFKWG